VSVDPTMEATKLNSALPIIRRYNTHCASVLQASESGASTTTTTCAASKPTNSHSTQAAISQSTAFSDLEEQPVVETIPLQVPSYTAYFKSEAEEMPECNFEDVRNIASSSCGKRIEASDPDTFTCIHDSETSL
jgi:hypothetical protein